MLLFVTMRRDTVEIRRRLHNFANLGIDVRHLVLADGEFAEFRGRIRATQIARRLWALAGSVFRVRRALAALGKSDILFVNALDVLFVTLLARSLTRNRSVLIGQLLDVHHYLLTPHPLRGVLRAVERRLLARIDLLIVPTKGNMPGYYIPIARYRGAFQVVHNTLPSGEVKARPPLLPYDGVWVVGWFGSLRCERALAILCRAAAALGPRLKVISAGMLKFPPGHFQRAVAGLDNFAYLGPFVSERDVAALYAQVHFSYAIHYEPPLKSGWSLPVRILEGGAYGRPAITRADADMGAFVRDNGIGWAVEADGLADLIRTLTVADYAAVARTVGARQDLFTGEAEIALALSRAAKLGAMRP